MDDSMLIKALKAAGVSKKERYSLHEVQLITGSPISTIRRQLRDKILIGQRVNKKWMFIYHDDLAKSLGGE
jgi:hypothetical protein